MSTCEEYVLSELEKQKEENNKLLDQIISMSKVIEKKEEMIKELEKMIEKKEI